MSISRTHRAGHVESMRSVVSPTAVMVTNDIVFLVAGGPVKILHLHSECIAVNDATASTLQWRSDPTVGTATTISGASASLASFAAGGTVMLNQTALATAPDLVLVGAGGVQIGANKANSILINPGDLELVIGVGSTTGTWKHFLVYIPVSPESYVTAA